MYLSNLKIREISEFIEYVSRSCAKSFLSSQSSVDLMAYGIVIKLYKRSCLESNYIYLQYNLIFKEPDMSDAIEVSGDLSVDWI